MKIRKIIIGTLVAALVFSAAAFSAACGPKDPPEPETSGPYQFYGAYEESGSTAARVNAAFLLNLNTDGNAVLDRYSFSNCDHSDADTNKTYTKSYMSGTWRETVKDGVDCLQIKLAVVAADGTTQSDGTYYAYESDGVYSFEFTFPIVPGMSFTRQVDMTGSKTIKYSSANAFIQDYKRDFVDPENILKVRDENNNAMIYFVSGGTLLLYSGYDQVATGKWGKDSTALYIQIEEEAKEVTIDGNKATFEFSYEVYAGYDPFNFAFEISDFTTLPDQENPNAADTVLATIVDEENSATLSFGKDKTYKITMDFGASGKYDVESGSWTFADNKVTLTPENGEPYESTASGGNFIVSRHIRWGGGAVNRTCTFSTSDSILTSFANA